MALFRYRNIDFYFERVGVGPVLVFTHSLSSDAGEMKELLGSPKQHSLVLWDTRGHGRTNPLGSPGDLTFAQFADDLHALLQHLEIDRAVFGGVSMGAAVSTRFALNWPKMVRGIILIRPAWIDQGSPKSLRLCMLVGELLERNGAAEGQRLFVQTADFLALANSDPLAARTFIDLFRKPLAGERHQRLQRIPADCPIKNWDEIKAIQAPAMVIGCNQDYVHPLKYAEEWASRLIQSTFEEAPSKLVNYAAYQAKIRSLVDDFMGRIDQGTV